MKGKQHREDKKNGKNERVWESLTSHRPSMSCKIKVKLRSKKYSYINKKL